MQAYRGWKQAGFSALLFVLVITLWVLFAPPQLGGATSFVVINGQSMEPLYHTGDLVIVRQTGNYEIGDIVAYRAFEERALVIHRIIGRAGERFVFKGDNNGWTDSFNPVQSELIGKAWIHIPKLGQVVRWLRKPLPFSLLSGLFGFALLSITFQEPEHPGRKRRAGKFRLPAFRPAAWLLSRPKESTMNPSRKTASETAPRKAGPFSSARTWNSILDSAIFLFGFLALAALMLGLFAFTRPLWRESSGTLEYQQTGSFSYTAELPEGIYDTTVLESGQPVFPRLICTIDLEFNYTLRGDQLDGLSGSHHLSARITEPKTGWSRSFNLEPRTAFRGNSFTAAETIDLCRLQELTRLMEEQTGLQAYYYSLTIEPQVEIAGTMAGQELQESFNPSLAFQFEPTVFYLQGLGGETDPLHPVQTGQITIRQMEPNRMTFFSQSYAVSALRRTAAISFGAAAFLLVAVLAVTWWLGKNGRMDSMQVKYGALLVDVDTSPSRPGLPVYRVRSMDDLARLAEREHTLILRVQEKDGVVYLVQAAQALYRYVAETGSVSSENQDLSRPRRRETSTPRKRKAGGAREK